MRTSMFLFPLLLAVALPGVFCDGDEPPYMDTLREVIYETNQYLIEKHLDVVDIPQNEFSNFFSSFQVIGGKVGNFSTSQLVGDAYLNETELTDQTNYYFSLGVGLTDMKIQLQYKAKFLGIFASSGTLNVVNTGNVATAVGQVVSSSSGTSHKCQVQLESVKVNKVGNIALTVEPSGIFHWILEKSTNLVLRLVAPFATGVIDSTVKKISEQDQVKQILTTVMCRYF